MKQRKIDLKASSANQYAVRVFICALFRLSVILPLHKKEKGTIHGDVNVLSQSKYRSQ
jgi:hypothetical protein